MKLNSLWMPCLVALFHLHAEMATAAPPKLPEPSRIGRPAGPTAESAADVTTNPGVEQYESGDRTIHVLLIGSERDQTIGSGVGASANKLIRVLQSTFKKADKLQVTRVGFYSQFLTQPGNELFDIATLNRAVSELKQDVKKNDVVLCYVLAHGAFDERHAAAEFEYGHWFQTDRGESLLRVNLMETLTGLGARLTVLISDSCNVPVTAPRPESAPIEPTGTPALYNLLLEYEGHVDLSASSQGQFSFYYPTGGLFTETFLALASNGTPYTWPAFFGDLQEFTDSEFKRLIGRYQNPYLPGSVQTTLTPMAMRPLAPDKNFLRKIAARPAADPRKPTKEGDQNDVKPKEGQPKKSDTAPVESGSLKPGGVAPKKKPEA